MKQEEEAISILNDDNSQPEEAVKPNPRGPLAVLIGLLGIMTIAIPFVVNYLGKIRSMSDVQVFIVFLGIVLVIIGIILGVIATSKNT